MLNRFQGWRERGWSPVDASTYASAWQRFGGSVATHPLVVERLADLAGIPVRYLAWEQDGEVKAAIPTWGRDLALSKDVLKRNGKKGLFDLGNAELILPAAADAQAPLRHRARYLSALNENRFSGLKLQTEQLAMARTPKNCRRSFATTSAANCACWKRRVDWCVRSVSFPVPNWRRSTVICSSAAGAFRPPARRAWPTSSSCCANC